MTNKKIVYVDLDGVIVDIEDFIKKTFSQRTIDKIGIGNLIDQHPLIFREAKPITGSVEGFKKLTESPKYDVYILSTAPWANEESWTIKRQWVEKYLGASAYKKLILSHHKNLLKGDYLIDDRIKNGVAEFKGEHLHFGQTGFEDWNKILNYLL